MKDLEKVFFYTNKTPIKLFFRILFWILLLDIILILSFSFVDYLNFEKYNLFNWISFEEHIIILFLFIHIFFFLYLFINWFFDYYKIYKWNIAHMTWILFKKKQFFVTEKINSITIYKSFFWRLFDYWDVSFYYNEKEFVLKNIPYPEEFVEFIEFFKED